MNTASILSVVTTPLALAALLLLLGAGVIRVVMTSARPQLAKQIARYGFFLSVIFGVMANLSYIVAERSKAEILIAGTVQNESGHYISDAIVNIPGRGRGITSDSGEFILAIPQSRSAPEYEAIVTAPGYAKTTQAIQGPGPSTINITVVPPKVSGEDIVAVAPDAIISHYVGWPQVDLLLTFGNPLAEPIQVSDMSLTLVAANGASLHLGTMGAYLAPGMPIGPAVPTMTIPAGQSNQAVPLRLYYIFFAPDSDLVRLSQSAGAEIQPFLQRGAKPVLSENLVKDFAKRAERSFFWHPGAWQMQLTFTSRGVPTSITRKFELTPEMTTRLRKVTDYYRNGTNTVYGFHEFPIDAEAQPQQVIRLN